MIVRPGSMGDQFIKKFNRGIIPPGRSGQDLEVDFDFTHIASYSEIVQMVVDAGGDLPQFGWKGDDGDTPSHWLGAVNSTPRLVALGTGTPSPEATPYQLADGSDVPSEDYGADSYREEIVQGGLNPGSNDVVEAGLIFTPSPWLGSSRWIGGTLRTTNGWYLSVASGQINFRVETTGGASAVSGLFIPEDGVVPYVGIIDQSDLIHFVLPGAFGINSFPAGTLDGTEKFSHAARANGGANPWDKYISHRFVWNGDSLADLWVANNYALCHKFFRYISGYEPVINKTGKIAQFRRPDERSFTDHNARVWNVPAGLPRCGNSSGLQVNTGVDDNPEAPWCGKHIVGVDSSYTEITGYRNYTERNESSALSLPIEMFCLEGQSNAKGNNFLIGNVDSDNQLPRSDSVILHYLNVPSGTDYISENLEPINTPGDDTTQVLGIESTFARDMVADGRRVAISKMVRSGSCLELHWDPTRTTSPFVYQWSIENAKRCLGYLPPGTRNRGVIWIQGECDSNVPEYAPLYQANLLELIAKKREDLGIRHLPFYIVMVSSGVPYADVATIRAAQIAVAATDPDIRLIDPDNPKWGASWSYQGDLVHYTPAGYQFAGEVIATYVDRIQNGQFDLGTLDPWNIITGDADLVVDGNFESGRAVEVVDTTTEDGQLQITGAMIVDEDYQLVGNARSADGVGILRAYLSGGAGYVYTGTTSQDVDDIDVTFTATSTAFNLMVTESGGRARASNLRLYRVT